MYTTGIIVEVGLYLHACKKGVGGSFPAPPTPRLRISASNRVFISVFERAAWLIRKRRVGDTLLDNSMVWKSGKVVLEATW